MDKTTAVFRPSVSTKNCVFIYSSKEEYLAKDNPSSEIGQGETIHPTERENVLTLSHDNLIRWFSALLLALVLATQAHAQGQSFRYFYDTLGQLVKVVDSSGNVVEYVYDKVGNIVEIKRSTAASLAIFNFTPQRGPVTTKVAIQGQGFSANPSDNLVRFNGTSAGVLSATATTLSVAVPVGATTGPISVQVGARTATSGQDFIVINTPVITSISPKAAFSGTTITNFQVTGFKLTGATFAFVPTFVPPVVTVNSATIKADGTVATLNLTVGPLTGQYALVATNAEGSSDATQSVSNTFAVFNLVPGEDTDGDGLTNADEVARGTNPLTQDTDGDGFSDGLEVTLGSDPLDKLKIPTISTPPGDATSLIFSAVNTINPGQGQPPPPGDATSVVVSVKNTTNPGQGQSVPPGDATSPVVAVKNTTNPGQGRPVPPGDAISPVISIQNEATP